MRSQRTIRLHSMMRSLTSRISDAQICADAFHSAELPLAEDLVNHTAPPCIAGLVVATMRLHAACLQHRIPDGRSYWIYSRGNSGPIALAGYHRRPWDPPQYCWGGWYVVDPHLPSPIKMLVLADVLAKCLALLPECQTLFAEVLVSDTQSNIHRIYTRLGLNEHAHLPNFYGPGQHLAVMSLSLAHSRASLT